MSDAISIYLELVRVGRLAAKFAVSDMWAWDAELVDQLLLIDEEIARRGDKGTSRS